MARAKAVIADSDGESDEDLVTSIKPVSSSSSCVQVNKAEPDFIIDFDEFLSGSQKNALGFEEEQAESLDQWKRSSKKSNATSLNLRKQIAHDFQIRARSGHVLSGSSPERVTAIESSVSQLSPSSMAKRCQSAVAGGSYSNTKSMKDRKRQKTYGGDHNNHFRSSPSDDPLNKHQRGTCHSLDGPETTQTQHDQAEQRKHDRRGDEGYVFGAEHPPREILNVFVSGDACLVTSAQQDGTAPHETVSSLEPRNGVTGYHLSPAQVSTMRSSMGNYESIHLEVGAGSTGLDINTNPFANSSQPASKSNGQQMCYETNREDLHAIEGSEAKSEAKLNAAKQANQDTQLQGHIVELDSGCGADPYDHQEWNHSSSCIDPALIMNGSTCPGQNEQCSILSPPRKRRKTDVFPPADTAPEECKSPESHDTPMVGEKPGKKRGRKAKDSAPASSRDLASNQGISNEIEDRRTTDERSSAKPPSDLPQDDQIATHMPGETCQQRPSRSRSKILIEADMSSPKNAEQSYYHTQDQDIKLRVGANMCDPQEPETLDASSTKLKKDHHQKKNKMKRAKTSAAALLGKSDKMLSDGEEDVVWVESMPAAIKMTVPGPLHAKVEEEDEDAKPELPLSPRKMKATTAGWDKEESGGLDKEEIENTTAEPPPPKKRGRKKKSEMLESEDTAKALGSEDQVSTSKVTDGESAAVVNVHENPKTETDADPTVGSQIGPEKAGSTLQGEFARRPLGEQDVNSSLHTPVRLDKNEKSVESDCTIKDVTTPSPSKSADAIGTSATPCEKGPTKHSPINPSGGTVKYRVGLSRRAAIPRLLKMVRKS